MKTTILAFAAARGLTSAGAILDAMLRPAVTEASVTTAAEKPAARLEFEAQVIATVSALMALVAPQVPEAQRLPAVASLNAKQIRDRIRAALPGLTVTNQREVQLLIAELQAFYTAAPGYGVTWPPAADFGQPTYPVATTTRTPGPSWWAQNFPNQSTPTLKQLREMLQ